VQNRSLKECSLLAGNCSTETEERRIQLRVNCRFFGEVVCLLRKVKVPGIEYFLNLDKAKYAIEEEEFGNSIELMTTMKMMIYQISNK